MIPHTVAGHSTACRQTITAYHLWKFSEPSLQILILFVRTGVCSNDQTPPSSACQRKISYGPVRKQSTACANKLLYSHCRSCTFSLHCKFPYAYFEVCHSQPFDTRFIRYGEWTRSKSYFQGLSHHMQRQSLHHCDMSEQTKHDHK